MRFKLSRSAFNYFADATRSNEKSIKTYTDSLECYLGPKNESHFDYPHFVFYTGRKISGKCVPVMWVFDVDPAFFVLNALYFPKNSITAGLSVPVKYGMRWDNLHEIKSLSTANFCVW